MAISGFGLEAEISAKCTVSMHGANGCSPSAQAGVKKGVDLNNKGALSMSVGSLVTAKVEVNPKDIGYRATNFLFEAYVAFDRALKGHLGIPR